MGAIADYIKRGIDFDAKFMYMYMRIFDKSLKKVSGLITKGKSECATKAYIDKSQKFWISLRHRGGAVVCCKS